MAAWEGKEERILGADGGEGAVLKGDEHLSLGTANEE